MDINGVDISAIDLDNSDFVLPEVVQGRYLNGDGDIYAYECAGNDDTTHAEVKQNLDIMVQGKMRAAGADHYMLHITGDGSDKGKRHEVAGVREYQANRKDKPKPKNLKFARAYIKSHMNSMLHYDQEADDGLAQFQQKFIDLGQSHLCVLDSSDKDLRMVKGLHLDPYTDQIIEVTGYDSSWYDADKAKVLGWGTSFFWHQILMGDTADNIPGLPAFGKQLSYTLWPTAPLIEAERRVEECTMPSGKDLTEKQYKAAKAKVIKLKEEFKQKAAGAVAVHKYLSTATNDKEAYDLVKLAYESYYGCATFDFTDWRENTFKRTSDQMLIEQGVLLWMRRSKGIIDLLDFFKDIK